MTIKGRKWVVTDAEGQRLVVEGDGVVGEYPRLEPGEHFSYNSYHTIGSDSVAEGAYFGITKDGEPVFTRIPHFEMRAPVSSAQGEDSFLRGHGVDALIVRVHGK